MEPASPTRTAISLRLFGWAAIVHGVVRLVDEIGLSVVRVTAPLLSSADASVGAEPSVAAALGVIATLRTVTLLPMPFALDRLSEGAAPWARRLTLLAGLVAIVVLTPEVYRAIAHRVGDAMPVLGYSAVAVAGLWRVAGNLLAARALPDGVVWLGASVGVALTVGALGTLALHTTQATMLGAGGGLPVFALGFLLRGVGTLTDIAAAAWALWLGWVLIARRARAPASR